LEKVDALLEEQLSALQGLAAGPGLNRLYGAYNAWARAMVEVKRGRFAPATAHAIESVRLFGTDCHELNLVWPYLTLGEIAFRTGDTDQARYYLGESLRLANDNDDNRVGSALALLCETELRAGQLGLALEYCQDYIRLAHKYSTPWNVFERLEMAARICARAGRFHESARLSGAAEALSEQCGRKTSLETSDVSFPGDWTTRYADVSLDALVPDWLTQPDGPAIKLAWSSGRAMTYQHAVDYALVLVLTPSLLATPP
jgi:tetratricopeptide (TPR) repeat protein